MEGEERKVNTTIIHDFKRNFYFKGKTKPMQNLQLKWNISTLNDKLNKKIWFKVKSGNKVTIPQ